MTRISAKRREEIMREPDSQLAIELVGALKYVQLLGCGVVHEERDGDRSFIAIDHNYEATIEMHYYAYAGKVNRAELRKQYPEKTKKRAGGGA